MLISLLATPENERGPKYAEQFFASLHDATRDRAPISLEFACYQGLSGIFIRFPKRYARFVRGQLAGLYPHVEQRLLPDSALESQPQQKQYWVQLRLEPDLYPLQLHDQSQDSLHRVLNDPIAGVLAALANTAGQQFASSRIQLVIWPIERQAQERAQRTVHHLMHRFMLEHPGYCRWFVRHYRSRYLALRWMATLSYHSLRLKKREEPSEATRAALTKLSSHCFEVSLRIVVSASSRDIAKSHIARLRGVLGQYTTPGISRFSSSRLRAGAPPAPKAAGWLLSNSELATLWHPTTEAVRSPRRQQITGRHLEPPAFLPSTQESDVVPIGRVKFQERNQQFGIRQLDRFQHVAIVGKTGQGKTGLLNRMIVNDMQCGRGVCLLEPHGDQSATILGLVPKNRTNDVIYFDPSDAAHPPAYNPLTVHSQHHKPIVAEELVAAIKKAFDIDETNSPRMLYILRNALLALLDAPDACLLDLQHMMRDGNRRASIVRHVQDAEVRAFWLDEFEPLPEKLKLEWTMPIRNKIGAYTVIPSLRNILGQSQNKIDLRRIMDEGKILIVNLSKGLMTENASELLGALLMAGIQSAAMSRADIPEEVRRPFFCYVDEFQSIASETFSSLLSESRKMKLGLCIAHQYIAQLTPSVAAAVFGNVGTYVSFAVSADDAQQLAEYFGGDVLARDLMGLPKYQAIAKLLMDGSPGQPFTMETLPPVVPSSQRSAQVRRHSQRRYSHSAHNESH